MSSAVVSTSAASGRHFLFDADAEPEVGSPPFEPKKPAARELSQQSVIDNIFQSKIGNRQSALPLAPASRLEIRPAPEMASSGIPAIDALTGGLARGCLTEICGPASSGRTSVLLAGLAAATRRGEYCAIVDASDALDPHSFSAANVDLDRLLWVRCGDHVSLTGAGPSPAVAGASRPRLNRDSKPNVTRATDCLEQVLRATDLLLESGGFGLIILDLADVPPPIARRIPLTTWFRFRRAVEHKPTILLAIEQQPIAGSCSSLLLELGVCRTRHSVPDFGKTAAAEPDATRDPRPAHAQLLTGLEINVELIRSRLDRKPARSVTFTTQTAWAG